MSGYDEFFKAARQAKRKRRKPAPALDLRMIIGLAAVCGMLGWLAMFPDQFESLIGRVEVRIFGRADAAAATKAENSADDQKKKAADSSGKNQATKAEADVKALEAVPQDFSHLEKLRERKEALDLREKELNELEEELHRQRSELEVRIERLEAMRREISSVLKDRVEMDQERVNKLVDTYSNMKPKQAAEIIAGIDEDLAVEVLGKMKKKNAAEILNLIEPGKARSLSEKYAGYRRR